MAMRKECPKCQASMTLGFIVDRTDNKRGVASWVDGEPIKNFWFGVKLNGKKPIPIQTHRCNRCGYLESYAAE